jgi:hypothetical protein
MLLKKSTPLLIDQIDLTASQTAVTPSIASVPNAFYRIGQAELIGKNTSHRDRCRRPTPTYNANYDPFKPLNLKRPLGYSPYVNSEPLFDNRPVYLPDLRRNFTVAGASKLSQAVCYEEETVGVW